jgi:formylglycine-generating enzyme required for sulfatase activity
MKFPVQCPHCREQVDMTFDLIGTDGNCQACGVDFVPTDASFGAESRYLLKRYLGAGGMGIVFAARDTALGRDVALKVPIVDIRDQRRHKIVERFKTEIRAIERLNHPHICSIYDSARWDGHLYYTMRFLEGGTLASRAEELGPLGIDLAVAWVLTVAQAMDYAHGMGVVHRDLKPANLMFDSDGRLLVTDFGLALFIDDPDETRITRDGDRLGSLAYMAPEQVRGLSGWQGPACDIYALGVILYELLTGRLPYRGQRRDLEDAILAGKPDRPSRLRPEIPRELDRICLTAMERLIPDRYDSMHALAGDLAEFQGGHAAPPSLPEPIPADPAGPALTPHGRLRIGMVRIPAGEFLMGSNEAQDERPVHRVLFPAAFWAGAFPVTQAEYRAVMGKLPQSLFAGQDRRPVDSVSWLDAVIFCNQLSARDGDDPYYKIQGERVRVEGGTGYRLLTEAEWEYAARGGGTGRYGATDDAAELDRFAWYAENSGDQTHPVGLKEPSVFHLHDMLGNVWEWCWDWYSREGYRGRADGEEDRAGPAFGVERVLRGGCWSSDPQSLRCAARIQFTPTDLPLYYFGFRLARSILAKDH